LEQQSQKQRDDERMAGRGFQAEQGDIEGRKLVFRRTRPAAKQVETRSSNGGQDRQPRHPLIGWMKGMITIMPGSDLTEPADPEWAKIAWGDEEKKQGDDDGQ
jgi:hypothetical protein